MNKYTTHNTSDLTQSSNTSRVNTTRLPGPRPLPGPLELNCSYLVFADYVNNNKKIDLTLTKNICAIFTYEEQAREFAKNVNIVSGKSLNMISVIFKIKNGERLDITSTPLSVYHKSPYRVICNCSEEEVPENLYEKLIISRKSKWCLFCRSLF